MEMCDCSTCRWAEWDYEEYYSTTQKEWFVTGCMQDQSADKCTKYQCGDSGDKE